MYMDVEVENVLSHKTAQGRCSSLYWPCVHMVPPSMAVSPQRTRPAHTPHSIHCSVAMAFFLVSISRPRIRHISPHPWRAVPIEHKQLVHKGLLLRDAMLLSEAGLDDDSTIYLVLNENPFEGKAMLVKTAASASAPGNRLLSSASRCYISIAVEFFCRGFSFFVGM